MVIAQPSRDLSVVISFHAERGIGYSVAIGCEDRCCKGGERAKMMKKKKEKSKTHLSVKKKNVSMCSKCVYTFV